MKNGMGEEAGRELGWEGQYGGKNHCIPKVVPMKFAFIK